jgi:dihydropteroate synthase-like protein
LILTGKQSYPILHKIAKSIQSHKIKVHKLPISISAFINQKLAREALKSMDLSSYDLVLLPGFVQWNSKSLEEQFSISIRKGPEFASDLPLIIENINNLELSTKLPADKLLEQTGEAEYQKIVQDQIITAKNNIDQTNYYINKEVSDLMIGRNLPPPIIAEIVNCTKKSDKSIIKKAQHYIDSGADIIDIGCIANKPKPSRVKEIIQLLRSHFEIIISIDSMNAEEIHSAIEEKIDMILSLDMGSYKKFANIPKDIPIIILPTNVNKGYFPEDPQTRVQNLFTLTEKMFNLGFTKLIADPLLETPISPGIVPSLSTYFLYKKKVQQDEFKKFELPMFFGISNVVELMDVDSVGVNGLLASIAIELDMGILFTVEHSTKLMGGVKELKEAVKLNYVSKYKKSPPINQGIQIFKAKGKTSQKMPELDLNENPIIIEKRNPSYEPDPMGYFKIYVNHYQRKIYVLFYSNSHNLIKTIIGINAEDISKRVIDLQLTNHSQHLNYLGRELSKAQFCLEMDKPYIQDSE